MAREYKDWLGHHRIDISPEVNRTVDEANKQAQFQRDMQGINQNFHDDLAGSVKSGLATTAVLGATAGVVSVAAAKNQRFRFKLQAVLHFPFAILASYVVFMLIGVGIVSATSRDISDDMFTVMLLASFALAIPVGIAWSVVYIRMRTLPKLRRLDQTQLGDWKVRTYGS